jgi:hypothetical protein
VGGGLLLTTATRFPGGSPTGIRRHDERDRKLVGVERVPEVREQVKEQPDLVDEIPEAGFRAKFGELIEVGVALRLPHAASWETDCTLKELLSVSAFSLSTEQRRRQLR